jgi:uncharacterized membrane protein
MSTELNHGEPLLPETHDLRRRSFRAGETIFRQGDAGGSMYVIESGEVQIRLFGDMAQALRLQDLHAGEFFGELSMFDQRPRSASAFALTDVVVVELEYDTFKAFLSSRPDTAMAIFRTLSRRLRETNSMLTGQAARNVDDEIDRSRSWSERLADAVAQLNGSWTFIGVLMIAITLWFALNSLLLVADPPDPYPYQFFNLVLGVLVGLQGPIIMMSQNRQGMKERARADTDYRVNLKNELNIERLVREITELRNELRSERNAPR